MIKPYIITKEQVKAYLGITDTTYDDQIDLYIPDVSDDITRKSGICNQSFLIYATATTDGTAVLSDVYIDFDKLYIGSQIYINGEDGEIESYDEDNNTITLTAALSNTAENQYLYIRNFPRGARQTIAKMVMFKIESTDTSTEGSKELTSESIGGVSFSYADISGSGYDKFGYPESLTKALRTIRRIRFA